MSTSALIAIKIFNNRTIAQNGNEVSDFIELDRSNFEGFFSLQVEIVSGTGVITGTIELSNNEVDYLTPSGVADIMTDFAPAGGPGTDGKDIFSFDPPISGRMQIRFTENNTGACVVNAWLVAQ